jgi:hypothetical protein
MSFFLSPIRFIFELIGFLISAAFVYGLAVFAAVVFLTYMIADLESREPIIEYVNVVEETIDNVCNRIDGCRIFWDRTGKEICPDCE